MTSDMACGAKTGAGFESCQLKSCRAKPGWSTAVQLTSPRGIGFCHPHKLQVIKQHPHTHRTEVSSHRFFKSTQSTSILPMPITLKLGVSSTQNMGQPHTMGFEPSTRRIINTLHARANGEIRERTGAVYH